MESIQEVHATFGGAILQRWRFAQDFIKVATGHTGPKFSSTTEKEILIVNLSNNLTRKIGYSLFDNDIELSGLESANLLELDSDTLENIGEETIKIMHETAHAF